MFVITNVNKVPLIVDGVSLDPGEQLSIAVLSPQMIAARDAGLLRVLSGDETLAERRADVDALNSFKP